MIARRLLRMTGRIQHEQEVVHVVAEQIEDITALLEPPVAKGAQNSALAPSLPPPGL